METCCQGACAPGPQDFFNYIAACLCGAAGPCTPYCSGAGDYCSSPGSISTYNCDSCFNFYVSAGGACDPTTGFIAASCAADPACNAYLTCANGCP